MARVAVFKEKGIGKKGDPVYGATFIQVVSKSEKIPLEATL
jgi:hypothetical protein